MVSMHLVDGDTVRVCAVAGPGPVDTALEGRRVALTTWERLLAEPKNADGLIRIPMRAAGGLVGIIAAEPRFGEPADDAAIRRAVVRRIAAQTAAMLSMRSDICTVVRDRDQLRAREAVLLRMVGATSGGTAGLGPTIPAQRSEPADAATTSARDPLTGLLNRRATLRRLEEYIAARRDPTRPGAAIHLVLDGLPEGDEAAGADAVLLAACRRVAGVLRKSDTPGRLADDAFLLIVPDLSPPAATRLAERVRAVVEAPISVRGRTYPVSAEIRVVPLTAATSVDDVLSSADSAAAGVALRSKLARSPRTSP